jgi:hypothetical protein
MMSKQTLVKLMEAAAVNEQLRQQLQEAGNYEAIKALANARGFDLGDLNIEEAQRTVDVITGEASDELTLEEMRLISDGWLNFEAIKTTFRFYERQQAS